MKRQWTFLILLLALLVLPSCIAGEPPAEEARSTPTEDAPTANEPPGIVPSPTVEPADPGTETVAPPEQSVASPPPGLLLALQNGAGGWSLSLVEAGGDLRLLAEEIAAPTYLPDFHVSPDGRQLLYAYQGDIWRLDVATGETKNVTQTAERLEAAPRWLPGNLDHFVAGSFPADSTGPAAGYLTLVGFDGSYELLDEEGVMGAPPAPSPDGQTIAYVRDGQPFLYHWEGPEKGSQPFALASFGLDWVEGAGEASWSPDGRRLAWTLLGTPADTYQAVLALLDLAHNDYQAVHSYAPAAIGDWPRAPLWDPGGDWLAYYPLAATPEARGLWLAEPGEEKRPLTTVAPRLTHVPNPALSPDTRWLAFTTSTGERVGLVEAGEWQVRWWQPPASVGAVGWVALPEDPATTP